MGKKLIPIILLVLLASTFKAEGFDPQPIDLRKRFIEVFRKDVIRIESRLETTGFNLFGWSRGNAIAYSISACPRDGNTFPNIYGSLTYSLLHNDGWSIIVQDLVSDRILWMYSICDYIHVPTGSRGETDAKSQAFLCESKEKSHENEAKSVCESMGIPPMSCLECQWERYPYEWPRTFAEFWGPGVKFFKEKLSTYSILRPKNATLLHFPIEKDGERISIQLQVKTETDDIPFPKLLEIKVDIISNRHGHKTIFHEASTVFNRPKAAAILGYIESPFQDRIAIFLGTIYGTRQKGFQGVVRIVGSSLSKEFN